MKLQKFSMALVIFTLFIVSARGQSLEENKKIITRYLLEIFNNKKLAGNFIIVARVELTFLILVCQPILGQDLFTNKKKSFMSKATIPNPALAPLAVLIGEWTTMGTHALIPDTTLYGYSSFEWIEGGAFLRWNSEVKHKDIPAGIAIFGSDDSTGEYFMLYFDERKVSRKYQVSLQDRIIKWWRDASQFSQQYTLTITDEGNTLIGKGELSKDGTTWEKDLDLTYTRRK